MLTELYAFLSLSPWAHKPELPVVKISLSPSLCLYYYRDKGNDCVEVLRLNEIPDFRDSSDNSLSTPPHSLRRTRPGAYIFIAISTERVLWLQSTLGDVLLLLWRELIQPEEFQW